MLLGELILLLLLELPTATAANGYYVHSGGTGIIALGAPGANQVIGITTTNATAGVNGADGAFVTVIDFPEGTQCPFEAGDAVSLTVTECRWRRSIIL